jgi:hypothetical protein
MKQLGLHLSLHLLWLVSARAFLSFRRFGSKTNELDFKQRRHSQQPLASPTSEQEYTNAEDSSDIHVILFGVGDLRVDDHLGLYNALCESSPTGRILPLFILSDDTLRNIPSAVAHTKDTASLLAAALRDLEVGDEGV